MNSSIDTLIVTAHPDDETIFFAGPIFSRPKSSVYVVCVTDGNADDAGASRRIQFESALKKFDVQGTNLELPDIYEQRLNLEQIQNHLASYSPKEVFTHNIQGEYGHPHHQDVSHAVHTLFAGQCEVFSTAYNLFPEIEFSLTKDEWLIRFEILSEIYWNETFRFQQFLPCAWKDGFLKMELNEVQAVYKALCSAEGPSSEDLKSLKPYSKYLQNQISNKAKRPF